MPYPCLPAPFPILGFSGQEKGTLNFEPHKLFGKSGQLWDNPPVNQREEKFIFPAFRGEHINFLAPVNPGATSRLSQGHLDVNQSKKLMLICLCLGDENVNPNIFFSNFSGRFRDIPAKSRDIPQKSLIPWVSRDIPNFLAPTPSRGRPPPHQKISGLKSLGLGSFFRA